MPSMTANTTPTTRGDPDMATVPIVSDGAASSRVAVGTDSSWDGAPLVVGSKVGCVEPTRRFPA